MNEQGKQLCDQIVANVSRAFVGDKVLLQKLLASALANGHVLFEDFPGLGKTLLVKSFAATLGCTFTRVQFTPDLLPADILGTKVWDSGSGEFRMSKGPIFTNVLLSDEINRAPPKTQSALLEAMEEHQVTIEGETLRLAPPFLVLATQNPIEQEGTYPLPEAQLDRFLLRLSMGYPRDLDDEAEILRRRIAWQSNNPTANMQPVVDAEGLRQLQRAVETEVYVHEDLLLYIGRIVRGLREHPLVAVGPSPRGALALLRVSRAMAFQRGRDFVTPDDIKAFVDEALAHRTLLQMERVLEGGKAEDVVREVVAGIPIPTRAAPEEDTGPAYRDRLREPEQVHAVPAPGGGKGLAAALRNPWARRERP